MKVLLCHKNIDSEGKGGGFSTVYANLALLLSEMGHKVFIISRQKVQFGDGISTMQINGLSNDQYAKKISDFVNLIEPDIIECPSWAAECRHVTQIPSAPPVVVRGDIPAYLYGEEEEGDAEKLMMQKAKYNIAVSQSIAETILDMYQIKVDNVIYHGVNHSLFFPKPKRKKIKPNDKNKKIVWVGRPSYMKGFDILQVLLDSAPKEFSFELILGTTKHPLKFSTKNANVQVHTAVSFEKLVEIYNSSDVFLSTSRIEGFGLAVLEAMACGTPAIIMAGSGGVTEVAKHGEGGFQFEETSEIIDIVMSLNSNHSDLALESSKKFSWKKCAIETSNVYHQIINQTK